MLIAEAAGSVGVKLLEKGVTPRVPKSRARNKSWNKRWIKRRNYKRTVMLELYYDGYQRYVFGKQTENPQTMFINDTSLINKSTMLYDIIKR